MHLLFPAIILTNLFPWIEFMAKIHAVTKAESSTALGVIDKP